MFVLLAGQVTAADDVDVIVAGAFPGAALLLIDGGAPRTVRVGQRSPEGVKVLAVRGDSVSFEVGGRRETLRVGERAANLATPEGQGPMTLMADTGGHFRADGHINGARVQFLVDTGATFVSIGRSDARRAGIDYASGRRAVAQTANGRTGIWLVKIDQLRLGPTTLHNVDAAVHDADLPVALLGMSALSRFELRNEGDRLTLRRRY
ncbi:MAG: TIGR02281 family clan AA aspartic protease [Rhodocyclaceae bacterium]|nr:TIGR02281 family clan AA aspartic protease [Rhodocyclaceae bacterium]